MCVFGEFDGWCEVTWFLTKMTPFIKQPSIFSILFNLVNSNKGVLINELISLVLIFARLGETGLYWNLVWRQQGYSAKVIFKIPVASYSSASFPSAWHDLWEKSSSVLSILWICFVLFAVYVKCLILVRNYATSEQPVLFPHFQSYCMTKGTLTTLELSQSDL